MDLFRLVEKFMESVKIQEDIESPPDRGIEIYNEDSVKFELAFFLRKRLGPEYKVQFERNIKDFGIKESNKEGDRFGGFQHDKIR